jgi:WD40 repeat protein
MSARFECGSEISAVSVSPDRRSVVVVGRSVLRIVEIQHASSNSGNRSISPSGTTSTINNANSSSSNTTHNINSIGGNPTADPPTTTSDWSQSTSQYTLSASSDLRAEKKSPTYSGCDVHWHPNPAFGHLFATGSTSGVVMVWNLQAKKHRVQEAAFTHPRAVNRVTWSMTDPHLLLTGCQDGIVRLFDIRQAAPRTADSASTGPGEKELTPTAAFASKADAVRDVAFSPSFRHYFATAHDNGRMQVWDMRNNSHPRIDLPAHTKLAHSLDWHPQDSQTIATASRDQTVRVWDLSGRPHQTYVVYTSDSVGRVRWRPGHKYQLATSASVLDFNANVWDIRNAFVPLYSLGRAGAVHHNVISCLEWLDADAMLTASKDVKGQLAITQTGDMIQPHRGLYPTQGIAFSAAYSDEGLLAVCTDTLARGDTEDEIQRRIAKQAPRIRIARVSSPHTSDFKRLATAYHTYCSPTHASYSSSTASGQSSKVPHATRLYSCESCAEACATLGEEGLAHAELWRFLSSLQGDECMLDVLKATWEQHVNMGDVQTCAVMLLVFRELADKIVPAIRGADCHATYVDVLRRMQLFSCAAAVCKASPYDAVSTESKQATGIRVSVPDNGPQDTVAMCAVCREPVRGILVWCRKCGKSGHMQHMRDCKLCGCKN